MKNALLKMALMITAVSGWTPAALAVGLAVSPSTIANDYVGKITLTITGLTNGQTVIVNKYADLNANGVIDSGEPLMQGGLAIDGVLPSIGGVRNQNVPGDEDGAVNGQIRLELFYPGGDGLGVIAGKYLVRVADPASVFAPVTQALVITQKVFSQGVSGKLTASGTGNPVANAMVVLLPYDSDPVTGMVTDSNGDFILKAAPGVYTVLPVAPGFVGDFTTTVTVSAGTFTPHNRVLPTATRTISGKVKDSTSGLGLPGIFIQAETADHQFVGAFSQFDGTYSLGVLADSWSLSPSSDSLPQVGYVGWANGMDANATSGNVTSFDLPVEQATALIYGTVKDNLDQPLTGLDIWSNDQSTNQYEASGRSFPVNADYCVGVRPGTWWVGPDSTALSTLGYICPGTNVTLTTNQAVRADLVATQVTAHLSGHVVDNDGTPVADIGIYANDHQNLYNSVTTDATGYFDIGVIAGTWYLRLNSEDDPQQRQLVSPEMQFTLIDGEPISNINFVARNHTAHISGYVRDAGSQPVNAHVYASATIGGLSYSVDTQTDVSGNYALPVINGTWYVGADASGYNSPGPTATVISGANAIQNFTLQAAVPLVITTTSLPNGTVGVSYSAQLNASGGQQPYNWYLPGGTITLPPGTLNLSGDGVLSGIPSTAGTYNFTVGVFDNYNGAATKSMSLTINPVAGSPSITSHPSNQAVTAGQNATFTVAASGTPTPGYQWQVSTDGGVNWSILVNAGAYGGVNLATLTVSTSAGFNNYKYRCVASNSVSSATSNTATLTVTVPNAGPNITTQPSNQPVNAGQNAVFAVVATGSPTPAYQWQVSTDNGANWSILVGSATYSGVNRPTLTVSSTNSGLNGYKYRCVVSNSVATVTSNVATLTVNSAASGAPGITTQPSNITVPPGQNAGFTVAASGTPTLGYQWQVSTDNGFNWGILVNAGAYSGVNLATLTVSANTGLNGYQYRCVVSNSVGTVTSNAATLTSIVLTASESWRLQYFGNKDNSGNGLDSATPDHDGIANLIKYGLVITPGSAGVNALPPAQIRTYTEGKRLALIFTRDPSRNDIALNVQAADSPVGPWATVATSTSGNAFAGAGFVSETNATGALKTVEVRDTVNMSGTPRRFMRIQVTR